MTSSYRQNTICHVYLPLPYPPSACYPPSPFLWEQVDKREPGGTSSPEQTFVRHVIDLHDKFLQFVSLCFQNHSLFHKVRLV